MLFILGIIRCSKSANFAIFWLSHIFWSARYFDMMFLPWFLKTPSPLAARWFSAVAPTDSVRHMVSVLEPSSVPNSGFFSFNYFNTPWGNCQCIQTGTRPHTASLPHSPKTISRQTQNSFLYVQKYFPERRRIFYYAYKNTFPTDAEQFPVRTKIRYRKAQKILPNWVNKKLSFRCIFQLLLLDYCSKV